MNNPTKLAQEIESYKCHIRNVGMWLQTKLANKPRLPKPLNDYHHLGNSFDAITIGDDCYCVGCEPEGVIDYNDPENDVRPIYPEQFIEGLAPQCVRCGHIHEYMQFGV